MLKGHQTTLTSADSDNLCKRLGPRSGQTFTVPDLDPASLTLCGTFLFLEYLFEKKNAEREMSQKHRLFSDNI